MKSRKMKKSDFVCYNSIAEMVEHLGSEEGGYNSNSEWNEEWYGTKTYKEAEERIIKGDDELAKMLRGSDKLDIHMPSTGVQKRIVTRVAGFAPHVPNFLTGIPNNMLWVEEKKVAKKVLTVIYGCNTYGDETAEEIVKVSARVVSCIMSLERKGYRVNLYASNVADSGSKRTGFITKLKDSGQHIDVLKMAFPLLSAAWNRRFGFRFREMCGWSDVGGSLQGYALRSWLKENNVKYDVALSFYDAKDIKTVEELEKLFTTCIKK